ncbi:MAG: cupin domain-containing protein [Alphaproteobacteria bacterium]|nr:cupin domain-containing protein [Alphaproteobacteria bacterium]
MEPELQVYGVDDRPWLPVPGFDGCAVKILQVDPVQYQVVFMAKLAAGTRFPRHIHHCPTVAFTLEGVWRYDDHVIPPRAMAYEPAGLDHEAACEEDCVVLVVMNSVDGRFMSAWLNDKLKVDLHLKFFQRAEALNRALGHVPGIRER